MQKSNGNQRNSEQIMRYKEVKRIIGLINKLTVIGITKQLKIT
jgi:hypothetical protein